VGIHQQSQDGYWYAAVVKLCHSCSTDKNPRFRHEQCPACIHSDWATVESLNRLHCSPLETGNKALPGHPELHGRSIAAE
jgi:hypothetical protein